MRMSSMKLLAVLGFAAGLSACNATTGILAANEPAHISKVQVSLDANLKTSERFGEMLRAKTAQNATRFGRAGAAKELRIMVKRHSYKNAAASLLIGDANYAGARVAVVDIASGKVQGEADASAIDSMAINGVVGAIISIAQDKEKVDERLADQLARNALTQAYGTSATAAAYERPVAEAEPAAAPAPATAPGKANSPKPAAPKPVPVAGAKPEKTAMAEPVAAAR